MGERGRAAAERHEALRAALRRPPASEGRAPEPEGQAGEPQGRAPEPARGSQSDEVVALRSRALDAAARAYTAAHGHPLDHGATDRPGRGRTRWVLDTPAGVAVAGLLVLVLVLLVLRHATAPATTVLGEPPTVEPVQTGPTGDGAPEPVPDVLPLPEPSPAGVVLVHVVGQVRAPGLVRVPAGSRVADVVAAAGGATAEADLAALNLARLVVDGEQVRVPAPGEAPPPAAAGDGGGSPGGDPGATVDLNTADEAELDALPGIGPVLAGRILAWRDEHGRFTSVEELAEVSGVGPRLLEGLRDLVVVG